MTTPVDPQFAHSRQQLRQQLRAKRRALSHAEQVRAANQLAHHLSQQLWFIRAGHIAFYLPNDGEIDPSPLLRLALAQGKHCYLPVVQANKSLQFRRYYGQPLRANRYGIGEPKRGEQWRPSWLLDLVLLPLVGFDADGNRLGMGGGFYDRSFAARAGRPTRQIRLVGLAHACQQVPKLPAAPWDKSLTAVATPSRLYLRNQVKTP